jgi:3-(3-hydroxy-phenyl)propionate hydroxylase
VLTGDAVDTDALRPVAGSGLAPVDVWRMADVHAGLAATLGARPDEAWLVRPDAHVAAVVDGTRPEALADALRRLLCNTAESAGVLEDPRHVMETNLAKRTTVRQMRSF